MRSINFQNLRNFRKFSLKIKLAALFAASLLVTCLAGLLLFAAQNVAAKNEPPAPAPAPIYEKLPPDAEEKIDEALFPSAQTDTSVKPILNPFRSSEKTPAVSAALPRLPVSSPVAAPVMSGAMPATPAPLDAPKNPSSVAAPVIAETDDLSERLKAYADEVKKGVSVPEKTSIYRLAEIEPIGITGSARRGQVVMFYVPKTKATIFGALGTRFRDGKLENVTADGVNLQTTGGTPVFKRWARLKSR